MRKIFLAATFLAGVSGAQAADMPNYPLRGGYSAGPARPMWDGFYVGGQASYGVADMSFANSGQDLLARMLNANDIEAAYNISKWPTGYNASHRNSGFGGFAGYNSQFEDVVIGLEGSYIHGDFTGASSGSQARIVAFPTDYSTTARVASSALMHVKDYGTLRLRGGYMAGDALVYGFAGAALGRADIVRSATYNLFYQYVGSANPPLPNIGPSTASLTEDGRDRWIYGYAAGLGVDWMLLPNLFLRAEYEYIRFTAKIDTNINTVRVGLGYKF